MTLLGKTVIYRSRTGDYSLAAVITATADSINQIGVERGQVPALTAPDRVHLSVLTPGLPPIETPATTRVVIDTRRPLGSRELLPIAGVDLEEGQFEASRAFGGTYQEFDIPWWRRPGILPGFSDEEAAARIMAGQVWDPQPWDLTTQPAGTWTYR